MTVSTRNDLYPSTHLFIAAFAVAFAAGCTAADVEGEDPLASEADALGEEASDGEADAQEPGPSPLEGSEEEIFDVAVGDMVQVEDGIELPVPAPGEVVSITIMYEDGATAAASLAHDVDGRVRITHPDDHLMTLPEGAAASCASKCSDQSYSYVFGQNQPAKWKETLRWHYRHRNSAIGKNAAIAAFKSGASAVPSSRNSCSMPDLLDARASYQGETNTAYSVTVSNGSIGCNAGRLQDGVNVIGWGGLPGSTLAVTCTRAVNDGTNRLRITDMDMRFDQGRRWFTGNSVPANCSDRFSLRGVATHEFGHAYGLGHTSQCNLVMAPATTSCTVDSRRFGRGDVLGLRTLY